jgi:uncharacterized protein with LGFP repeats
MGSHSHGPVGYGTSLADHFASLGLHESVEPATDKQRAASFPPISTTVVSYPPSTAIASPPPASNYPYGLSRGPIGARGGHLRSDTSRPHSTDAYSSHSSGGRSWVLDSDASSVCSMASSNQGIASEGAAARSNARTGRSVVVYEDGSEEIFEEGGEVYRPESEGGDIDCEFACSASAPQVVDELYPVAQSWTSVQNRQKRRCKLTAPTRRESCCA